MDKTMQMRCGHETKTDARRQEMRERQTGKASRFYRK